MVGAPAGKDEKDERVKASVARYRMLLESVYGGRKWVLALDVMSPLKGLAETLQGLGATEALCIAATRGLGELPDETFAPTQILLGGVRSDSLMEGLRASMDALADLPAQVIARVDEFDPGRDCQVLAAFFGDDRPIAGRRVYAARPEHWRALEDKTRVDAFWDAVGVEREPSEVLSSGDLEQLWTASQRLDRHGDGVVWVGDDKEGFNGAGEYARWVKTRADAESVVEFFAAHCDQVRVMPFLEGVPCSIHGIVFADDQIALRPCEMVVLRKAGTTRFHYAGSATFWDPPPPDRRVMRALAYKVGAALREQLDYRGVFTIDGVMTQHGFRPTELNPRFGGAIGQLGKRIPELPLVLLHFAIIENDDIDWRPRELEALLLDLGDEYRAGVAMAVVDREITAEITCGLTLGGWPIPEAGQARLLDDENDEASDFTVQLGPVGPSYAPAAARALNFLNIEMSLGLGRHEPAKSVNASHGAG